MRPRGTKIIATLGPSASTAALIGRLIASGVDIFRLNFSHGTHETHGALIAAVRSAAKKSGRHVAILADLMGPKIRTGLLAGDGPVTLRKGRPFTITTRSIRGDSRAVSTTYKALPRDAKPGDKLLLDDGRLVVRVKRVKGSDVETVVEVGGPLGSSKGLAIPTGSVSASSLTAKDRVDLAFAIEQGVDWIALSFVRSAADVNRVRRAIQRAGASIPVVAKIERHEAVGEIDAILKASDAVMIARGDLGVEVRTEQVPIIQKTIIDKAGALGVPVITATQMLDSMMERPRPTRAEATDVANAVLDGTDAVMLSGETAAGRHPVEAVRVMAAIVREAEASEYFARTRADARIEDPTGDCFEAVTRAAIAARREACAKAIVAFTESGHTALLLSMLRPEVPVLALTSDDVACRRMALYWGVEAILTPFGKTSDEMIRRGQRRLMELRKLKRGDLIVEVAGTVPHVGATNMMKIFRLGTA